MKVVVVIPTYNEEGSVGRLLELLAEEFSQIKNHECHVLIVDGNSPDRTQEIVLGFANEHQFAHLLVEEKKEGLGAAYMKGYKKALHEMKAEVVMEMDGDLQHDPKYIHNFLEEIDKGADFVIGSRYIPGGSIPSEWNFVRKFWSWGGNIFARVVFGMWGVHEFTTSYRATRATVLQKIDLSTISSNGFAYKLDLIYRIYKTGAKIKEIPIQFAMRDEGISKMEGNNPIESLRVVLMVVFRENKSFFKFMVVGASGALVDFGFANLLRFSGVQAGVAATLAIVIAMAFNFTLNNIWSFNQHKILGAGNILKKFLVFVASSAVPIAFRFLFVSFVIATISSSYIAFNLAIAMAIGLGLLWNYFFYSRVVWNTQ